MSKAKEILVSVAGLLSSIAGFLLFIRIGRLPYRLSPQQAGVFETTFYVTLILLAGGLVSGVTTLKMARPQTVCIRFARMSTSLSIIGLTFIVLDVGNLGVHSTPSTLNICINNQRTLDEAKEEWVLGTATSNGEEINWSQIKPKFPGGFPKCPSGGEYRLGKAGVPVTCSLPQHREGTK